MISYAQIVTWLLDDSNSELWTKIIETLRDLSRLIRFRFDVAADWLPHRRTIINMLHTLFHHSRFKSVNAKGAKGSQSWVLSFFAFLLSEVANAKTWIWVRCLHSWLCACLAYFFRDVRDSRSRFKVYHAMRNLIKTENTKKCSVHGSETSAYINYDFMLDFAMCIISSELRFKSSSPRGLNYLSFRPFPKIYYRILPSLFSSFCLIRSTQWKLETFWLVFFTTFNSGLHSKIIT